MNKQELVKQIEAIYAENWGAGVDEDEEIILRLKKLKNGYKIYQIKEDRGGVIIRLPLSSLQNSEEWIEHFLS